MALTSRTFRSIIAGITTTVTTASVLAAAQPANAETITYNTVTASSPQTWTVPAGVTSITVTATGGAGVGANAAKSGFDSSVGGDGASVTVTRAVTAGEQFVVHIAKQDTNYTPAYCSSPSNAGGGGHFAAIWASGASTSDAVVAGGGGGGGCSGPSATTSATVGDGGAAGLPTSSGSVVNGSAGSNGDSSTGGGGGTSSAGGTGGTGNAGTSISGSGNPAGVGGYALNGAQPGGGGGGGYYGGGGGGTRGFSGTPGGGGGGSSKVDANWDFVSSVANSSTSAQIIITTSSTPPAPTAETVTIPTYTFSFDTSDGSPCLEDITVEDGQAYVLPSASVACAPEGSELVGWSIRGQEWAFRPGATVQVSASQTFQAVARLPIISVTYDSNVGMETECSAKGEDVTQESRRSSTVNIQRADQEATLATSAHCAPPGFELIGWTDTNTPDGSGQAQPGAQTYERGAAIPDTWNIDDPNPVNRVRLYALWGRSAS